MNTINILFATFVSTCNVLIYKYLIARKATLHLDSREKQPMSHITQLFKRWRIYSRGLFVIYVFVHNLYLYPKGPTVLQIGIAGSMCLIGMTFLYFSLKALGTEYSDCYDAYIPKQMIQEGPYRYCSHPIYLANSLTFLGLLITHLSVFTSLLYAGTILFYISAIRDEKEVLKKFQNS